MSSPLSGFGVCTARWILVTIWHGPEEKFVCTAVGAHVRAILAPVDCGDEGGVALAGSDKGVAGGFVDVNVVVMGTNSKVGAVGRVGHAFNPLLGVSQFGDVGVVLASDADMPIVHCHSDIVVANSDGTRALGVRVL